MLEQNTLQEGLNLMQAWGPVATCFVAFFFYSLWSNFQTKKKAIDPIIKIHTELEKRVPREWVEEKLKDYQLKEMANAYYDSINKRFDTLERLIKDLKRDISIKS